MTLTTLMGPHPHRTGSWSDEAFRWNILLSSFSHLDDNNNQNFSLCTLSWNSWSVCGKPTTDVTNQSESLFTLHVMKYTAGLHTAWKGCCRKSTIIRFLHSFGTNALPYWSTAEYYSSNTTVTLSRHAHIEDITRGVWITPPPTCTHSVTIRNHWWFK